MGAVGKKLRRNDENKYMRSKKCMKRDRIGQRMKVIPLKMHGHRQQQK